MASLIQLCIRFLNHRDCISPGAVVNSNANLARGHEALSSRPD
jgi:hypothetical protein